MIPTSYEVAGLIEQTLRLTNSTYQDLSTASEISEPTLRRATKEVVSAHTLRSINKGITALLAEKLSPFDPPTVGYEAEWLTLYQAIRHYIEAMQADILDPVQLTSSSPRKRRAHSDNSDRDIRRWKKELDR